MSEILKKLGDKAKGVVSSLKSLPPGDSEAEGIKSAQENVDAVTNKPKATQESQEAPYEQDKVHPLERYGSRTGEKRIDTANMTKPLGSVMPVYDRGGDVSIEASRRLQSSGDEGIHNMLNAADEQPYKAPATSSGKAQPTLTGEIADYRKQKKADNAAAADRVSTTESGPVMQPSYLPGGGPSSAAPPMPVISMNQAPLYDEGGEVTAKSGGKTVEFPKEQHGDVTAKSGMTPIHFPEQSEEVTAKSGNTPVPMPKDNVTAKSGYKPIPLYDEGGENVDIDDGKHQVAIVKEGERVLTPEQNEQYKKEHPEVDKGAPAEFGGRVFPNPTGIKPHADTDSVTPKTYPAGAHMNLENAAVDEGDKDSNRFPSVVATPASADTLSLKPYGKVMEDKANQKASQLVAQAPHANVEPSTSDVQGNIPEEKPKRTYGDVLAQQWLKRNGVSSVTDLAPKPGATEDQTAPSTGATPAPVAPTARGPMKPIVQSSGKEAFQAQIAVYDRAYQESMDKAAATNDPQYREQASRIQEAKLAYEKSHPWGSPESAHPGVLGKLGHAAEMVLSRAPVSAPIMTTIPGSEASRARETTAAQAETKAAAEQNAAENKAAALPGYHQVTGGAVDPQHPELGPQVAFESEKDPAKIVYQGPITPKTAAGGDKATFEKTLAKINSADVADPNKQRTAIEQAHTDKKITDEEYNNANAYLGANSNAPATQAGVAQTKEEQKVAAGFRGKVLVFQNPDGSRQGMTYEQAKAEGRDLNGAMTYTPMAADKLRETNKGYANALRMFSDYEKDMGKTKLTTDDERALQILTSHVQEEGPNDYATKIASGFMDTIMGEPLTGYSTKAMGGIMTKDQWDKMSPAARTLAADYFQTLLAHFQNIKNTQGSIPRNPALIRTDMSAIPLPYLNIQEAKPAFDKYFDRLQDQHSDAVRFGTPKTAEVPTAPEGATQEAVDKSGKVVGHVVNGRYVPIQQ